MFREFEQTLSRSCKQQILAHSHRLAKQEGSRTIALRTHLLQLALRLRADPKRSCRGLCNVEWIQAFSNAARHLGGSSLVWTQRFQVCRSLPNHRGTHEEAEMARLQLELPAVLHPTQECQPNKTRGNRNLASLTSASLGAYCCCSHHSRQHGRSQPHLLLQQQCLQLKAFGQSVLRFHSIKKHLS